MYEDNRQSVNRKKRTSAELKIRTLGAFDLEKEGTSMVDASPGARKIWELLKFMLANRGKSLSVEDISDQLWSSEEYNDPGGTIRRQMQRLREVLQEEYCRGCDNLILLSNGMYRWNEQKPLTLDCDIFEVLVTKGIGAARKREEGALELLQEALALYEGDFLTECSHQHWVFPLRSHYRRLFREAVLTATGLLKTEYRYEEAIRICEHALGVDLFEEQFHIQLIEAMIGAGNREQALKHYEYVAALYQSEMGVSPSEEMQAVYRKITNRHLRISNEHDLQEVLQIDMQIQSAYYCEPDVFKSIFELERRRGLRSGGPCAIGVVTRRHLIGSERLQDGSEIEQLKQHLMSHLRKGDCFTVWNTHQVLVLLSGTDAKGLTGVLRRVLGQWADGRNYSVEQIHELPVGQSQNTGEE